MQARNLLFPKARQHLGQPSCRLMSPLNLDLQRGQALSGGETNFHLGPFGHRRPSIANREIAPLPIEPPLLLSGKAWFLHALLRESV